MYKSWRLGETEGKEGQYGVVEKPETVIDLLSPLGSPSICHIFHSPFTFHYYNNLLLLSLVVVVVVVVVVVKQQWKTSSAASISFLKLSEISLILLQSK